MLNFEPGLAVARLSSNGLTVVEKLANVKINTSKPIDSNWLFKRGNRDYLIFSENGGEGLYVARSSSGVLGPYERSNQVLILGNEFSEPNVIIENERYHLIFGIWHKHEAYLVSLEWESDWPYAVSFTSLSSETAPVSIPTTCPVPVTCPTPVTCPSCPVPLTCPEPVTCPSCPVPVTCPTPVTSPEPVTCPSCPVPVTCPTPLTSPEPVTCPSCPVPVTCPEPVPYPKSVTCPEPVAVTCPNCPEPVKCPMPVEIPKEQSAETQDEKNDFFDVDDNVQRSKYYFLIHDNHLVNVYHNKDTDKE